MKRRPNLLRLLVGTLLLAGVPEAQAASSAKTLPDPRDPKLKGIERLNTLVERIKIEQAKMKTLEARFVQKQESSLLTQAQTSTGVLSYAAPDRVRWEYLTPNPISVVIAGEKMTTWYRDLERAETLKVGRYSAQVFKYLGASGSMKTLLDYFTVALTTPGSAGKPYRLDLTPRYSRIAKRMKSMTLWIDEQRFLPTKVEVIEGDGDKIQYELLDLKINAALPADRFQLNLPPGVATKVLDLDRGAKPSDGSARKPPGNPVPHTD